MSNWTKGSGRWQQLRGGLRSPSVPPPYWGGHCLLFSLDQKQTKQTVKLISRLSPNLDIHCSHHRLLCPWASSLEWQHHHLSLSLVYFCKALMDLVRELLNCSDVIAINKYDYYTLIHYIQIWPLSVCQFPPITDIPRLVLWIFQPPPMAPWSAILGCIDTFLASGLFLKKPPLSRGDCWISLRYGLSVAPEQTPISFYQRLNCALSSRQLT